jgi:membrane-associated phospholipid phosphatase
MIHAIHNHEPELAQTLLARRSEYGENRIVWVVHYPSDVV